MGNFQKEHKDTTCKGDVLLQLTEQSNSIFGSHYFTMSNVHALTFNLFRENTYIIWDATKECAIIDPGCMDSAEQEQLADFIESEGLNPAQLILTHGHVDHVLGVSFVKQKYGLSPIIHKLDVQGYMAVPNYAQQFGFADVEVVEPTSFMEHNDTITIGKTPWRVIFTPGHTPGEVCLYHEESKQLIAGDVLFQGSIGRTDLPGGNHQTLIDSIKTELMCLPDDVKVYSGHGPTTSIGYERQYNPFL